MTPETKVEAKWCQELTELYLARDWTTFAQQYASWYRQASRRQKLMLLRRLSAEWCDNQAVTKVLAELGLT